jgi:hypothetical protein
MQHSIVFARSWCTLLSRIVMLRAPLPNFRCVELFPYRKQGIAVVGATASSVASFTCSSPVLGLRHAAALGLATFATVIGGALVARRADPLARSAKPSAMTLLPWGVLISKEHAHHALRWSSVHEVSFESTYDRAGNGTLYSVVKVSLLGGERLVGRTFGDAPLERLTHHLAAYRAEQEAPVASDLESLLALPPTDPCVETLLLSVEGYVGSALGACAHARSYRASESANTAISVERLRAILQSREMESADPRPVAALLSAKLGYKALSPTLLSLVQSPHPMVAATAKRAAQVLGVPESKTGSLQELSAFASEEEMQLLSAWGSAPC